MHQDTVGVKTIGRSPASSNPSSNTWASWCGAAYDGLTGLEEARMIRPALIVLDIMLPRLDGVGVLKRLREGGSRGARDHADSPRHHSRQGTQPRPWCGIISTKPFDIEELLARIRALLRRAEGDGYFVWPTWRSTPPPAR